MSRGRTAAELALVFALLLALVWRVSERVLPSAPAAIDAALGVAVGAVVVGSWWRRRAGLVQLGLAPSRFAAGLRSAAFVSIAGAVALFALGLALGSVSLSAARFAWLADYLPGLAAQQLLLQDFFAPGFAVLAGVLPRRAQRAATILLSALAFAALHAPNPALMAGVALAGAFWTAHFLAHRNLLAVFASHLVLGATAMAALGPGPMLNLRVGPGALELFGR